MGETNSSTIFLEKCDDYTKSEVAKALNSFEELFSKTIFPGATVMLKPNWIAPHHRYDRTHWESVITHPQIITGVLRKVVSYLDGKGHIIIADGPQTDSSFKMILSRMPVGHWKQICESNNIKLTILDLRDEEWVEKGDVIIRRKKLQGDPLGSVLFDLKSLSEFEGHEAPLGYYGADYDYDETNNAHRPGRHLYQLSKTAMMVDVFINLPKLKTHKKAGITCSLKNLVGINTHKNYLPHYSFGSPRTGGDEFPDDKLKNWMESGLLRLFKRAAVRFEGRFDRLFVFVKKIGQNVFGETKETIRGGNWYGNDTVWRMVLDLNKAFFYGSVTGEIREDNYLKQRRYLTIVDGIIAGQGNGPEAPDPLRLGTIIAGGNPVAIDCACAKMLGFDYRKIPLLANAFKIQKLPLIFTSFEEIMVVSCSLELRNVRLKDLEFGEFPKAVPPSGWMGYVEI